MTKIKSAQTGNKPLQ